VTAVLHAATPRDALEPGALRSLSRDSLAAYLGARRWFGAKGRAIRAIAIDAAIPVSWPDVPDEAFAIALVRVELEDGAVLRYQLPLGTVPATDALATEALARVETQAGATVALVDAVHIPDFRRGLAAGLRDGAAFSAGDRTWQIETIGDGGVELPDASKVAGAEQSNTSLIYGDVAICKFFRRLEPGENPDVEIARFLTTRTDFRNTPQLMGVLALEEDGRRTVAGMVSRFMPGSRDAWAHALDRADAYLRAGEGAENAFAAEARRLGTVTRGLHEALSSDEEDPDFAPAFATDDDVQRWSDAALAMLDRGMTLLAARAGALEGQTQAHARALVQRRPALEERVRALAEETLDAGDPGMRIRHHGDYHLGQVLRTVEGRWMIIDFEGEPSRPLEERRARHSPLRDVAGMLRSFAYAAASGAMRIGGLGRDSQLETRVARWEREARENFLGGYLAEQGAAADALLPSTAAGATALLGLFEAEKLFYELGYELDNRPAWAWIPLRGIAKLL
jgi:maltose alpha-D-glucosyltransferase/alpha-amylase